MHTPFSRIGLVLVLLGAPLAARAQTPADIARQSWPLGRPVSANQAPSQAPDAGAGSGRDIARQVWPFGAPASDNAAPLHPYAGGKLSGRYLARLRDGFPAWLSADNAVRSPASHD